jgi:hypothetical protein
VAFEPKSLSTSCQCCKVALFSERLTRLKLSAYARKVKTERTIDNQIQLQERRLRLLSDIETSNRNADLFLDTADNLHDTEENIGVTGIPDEFLSDTETTDDDDIDLSSRVQPEDIVLTLPSSLGPDWCAEESNRNIVQQEIGLRQGQANDALHHVRIGLAEKSFTFRTQIRNARSQKKKTIAWNGFHSLEANLRHQVRVYSKARHALVQLGADAEILAKYQVLKPEDLKVSTAVVDPRLPSRKEANLAWFWKVDVQGDTTTDGWMAECKNVMANSTSGSHLHPPSVSGALATV